MLLSQHLKLKNTDFGEELIPTQISPALFSERTLQGHRKVAFFLHFACAPWLPNHDIVKECLSRAIRSGFQAIAGLRPLRQPIDLRLQIAKMTFVRPSIALDLQRDAIRNAASRFAVVNPRVFGAVLHGLDTEGSDLDLLVDPLPGTTLFDLGGLQLELEELLGVSVDLLTPGGLPERFREQVLAEARPV